MKEVKIKIEDESIERSITDYDFKNYITLKNISTTIVLFLLLLIVGKITYSIIFPNVPDYSHVKDSEYFAFPDLLPKINTSVVISSIDELFTHRLLFINEIDITKDYIQEVRNNITERDKNNSTYTQTEIKFTQDYFSKRVDQYNYIDYFKLCLEGKKIYSNPVEYYNTTKPFISIILCTYNNKDLIISSVRSIQNQSLKNIEIIFVDDGSSENMTEILQYLMETDPRVRVFYHLKNLGLWRSRIDGFLYSKGKYIVFFDPGDYYEDNYVLEDAYNLMEKYNLDSVKMAFRVIGDYTNISDSKILYHADDNSKIVYGGGNIENYDASIFGKSGNIWNRFIKANVFTKGLCLLSDGMLNIYQNMIDDFYFNKITNKVSNNFLIVDRVGYVYYYDGKGHGTPKTETEEQRNASIQQMISVLTFEYFFSKENDNKESIISKIKEYDNENSKFQLKFFRTKFYLLYNLITSLIEDHSVSSDNKTYLSQLLSRIRDQEKEIKSHNN